jgi:hypothetical protein
MIKLIEKYKIIVAFLFVFPLSLHAQDNRILGTWTLQNSPISQLSGSTLTITKENVEESTIYNAAFSFPGTLPAPINCKVPAGTSLLQFTLVDGDTYAASYFTFSPGICETQLLLNQSVTITFDSSGNNFSACAGAACVKFLRQGTPRGPISLTTVPPNLIPVGSKGSISAAFLPVEGAYAYRVTIKGPLTLARTIKKGLFTKFVNLPSGSYKVSYVGFFKEDGKILTTKASLSTKAKVTK